MVRGGNVFRARNSPSPVWVGVPRGPREGGPCPKGIGIAWVFKIQRASPGGSCPTGVVLFLASASWYFPLAINSLKGHVSVKRKKERPWVTHQPESQLFHLKGTQGVVSPGILPLNFLSGLLPGGGVGEWLFKVH